MFDHAIKHVPSLDEAVDASRDIYGYSLGDPQTHLCKFNVIHFQFTNGTFCTSQIWFPRLALGLKSV